MCVVYVCVCVCPHRAARAFGEYLSHTHPENRNGSGQRLCHPVICPSLYLPCVYSCMLLVLFSPHPLLKCQEALIGVSRWQLITKERWLSTVPACHFFPTLSVFLLFSTLVYFSFFGTYSCLHNHLRFSNSSSSSVWNLGGSWPGVAKWHIWPQQQQPPPSLLRN